MFRCSTSKVKPNKVTRLGYAHRHFHESSDCFEYPPKSLLKSNHPPQNTNLIFLPKKSRNWNIQTPKNPLIITVPWNRDYPPGGWIQVTLLRVASYPFYLENWTNMNHNLMAMINVEDRSKMIYQKGWHQQEKHENLAVCRSYLWENEWRRKHTNTSFW